MPFIKDKYHTVNESCTNLTAKERCFCAVRIIGGRVEQNFHMHIPKNRMSEEIALYVIEELVMHFAFPSAAAFIVGRHLNNRKGEPSRYPSLNHGHQIDYKTRVVRKIVSANDCWAWTDVILVGDIVK